jgi:hypothetical protein
MSQLRAIATKTPQSDQDAAEETEQSKMENGDVFVVDTSEYVGQWEGPMLRLPVELCMIVDDYEYVYKLDRREKREEPPASD